MLEMLNKELSYEDIIYFRSLALVVMKRDQIVGRRSVPPAKKEPEIPQTQGWWSWITGGGTNSMQPETSDKEPTAGLSPQQRKELLELFGLSDKDIPPDVPTSLVQIQAIFSLERLSIALHDNFGNTVTELLVSNSSIHWTRKKRDFEVQAAIGKIEVEDLEAIKGGELFPHLVSLRVVPRQAVNSDATFTLDFRNRPNSSADYALNMRLLPLEVVISPSTIARVFFHFSPFCLYV